jgi:hypothetical protein
VAQAQTPKNPLIAEAKEEVVMEGDEAINESSESAVVITDQAADNLSKEDRTTVLGRIIAKLPGLNGFTLTKSVSIALTLIILMALVIDTFIITRKRIVRLSGKGLAHLIFLVILLILLLGIQPGLIL